MRLLQCISLAIVAGTATASSMHHRHSQPVAHDGSFSSAQPTGRRGLSARFGHPLPYRERVSTPKEDFINVVDYGATGDNKTDNTQAFQSAIEAAATMDGIQVGLLCGCV